MDEEKKTLEQLLAEVVFSDTFRRNTARVILPPVTAGAVGIVAGCAGFAAYRDYACDPLKNQRHEQHIEQSTSTATISLYSVDDVVLVYQRTRRSS